VTYRLPINVPFARLGEPTTFSAVMGMGSCESRMLYMDTDTKLGQIAR
jgi:hypothetical protein